MKFIAILILFMGLSAVAPAQNTGMLNPLTNVDYNCLNPITAFGVSLGSSGNPGADAVDTARSKAIPIFMMCGIRPCFALGMSMPSFVLESTTQQYAFPSLGLPASSPVPVKMGGAENSVGASDVSFTHNHIVGFNLLKLLDLFQDVMCASTATSNPLDILYLSEVDPTANSSSMANMLYPESVLMANPVVAASCAVDAVSTLGGTTQDGMYWCVGGHSVFPVSNYTTQSTSYDDASAVSLAKLMYRVNRETAGKTFGMTAGLASICSPLPSPLVIKSQYRLQPAMPILGLGCNRLGTPSIKWNTPKRTTINGDMVQILWQREDCCAL